MGDLVSPLQMRSGAVAVVDALGFKAARQAHGVERLFDAVRRVRSNSAKGAELDNIMGVAETTVAAFSDSVILATMPISRGATGTPSVPEPYLIEHLAASVSSLVASAAFGSAPLAYRGCIAAGSLAVADDIFVGEAIDEAAELSEQSMAAVVWLAPSAVAALVKRRSKMVLVEWDVPLHGRGSLRTLVVNPFFSTVLLSQDDELISKRMDEVESTLLLPFESSRALDVTLKRQHTAAFLRVAREFSLKTMPEALKDAENLLSSFGSESDA